MSNKKLLRVFSDDDVIVLDLGEMEIWDGADMALLRETLTRLITTDKQKSIGVDMRHVKYIPSGFFGMLYDWFETGVQIRLYSPQPNVRRMLWFNRFFKVVSGDCHELTPRPDNDFPRGYPLAELPKETNRRNGHTNGRKNGHPDGHKNGHQNGHPTAKAAVGAGLS
jgi:anti-anti-sigma regulatory factor